MILAPRLGSLAVRKTNIRDVSIRNINAGAVLPSFTGLTSLRNLTVTFNNAAIAFPALTLNE